MLNQPCARRVVAAHGCCPILSGVVINMWSDTSKIVWSMAAFRLLSGSVEILAALLILRHQSVQTAFQINALLGLVGPAVLIIVSLLGIVGLAGKVPYSKIALIVAGVLLILYASRK